MNEPMPELLSAALFERGAAALTAHRRAERGPLAAQWVLPLTRVSGDETAEEAVVRHAREQFGVTVTSEVFFDTVYLQDPDDGQKYVANIFRVALGDEAFRFRADGDYDDVRWLAAPELEGLWMPPELRDAVTRALTEPDEPAMAWEQGVPLAERLDESPPPDNRAAWNTIGSAYRRDHERYGGARLRWGRGAYEDALRILVDVRGQAVIVLGCGDGRDAIALRAMGAVVTGVDVSPAQITYARELAAMNGAANASFVEADATDLAAFGAESFDGAVSICALDFVEDAAAAVREAARVLRGGGVLAFAVVHPWSQMFGDVPPYTAARSYWLPHFDTNWDRREFGAEGMVRIHRRTIEQWTAILTGSGFAIERIVEPYQGDVAEDETDGYDGQRARLMPELLIIKARKRS